MLDLEEERDKLRSSIHHLSKAQQSFQPPDPPDLTDSEMQTDPDEIDLFGDEFDQNSYSKKLEAAEAQVRELTEMQNSTFDYSNTNMISYLPSQANIDPTNPYNSINGGQP